MKTRTIIPIWIALLSCSLKSQTPDEAIHFLENENGIQLTADISNKESDTATSIIIGEEMWVSWKAADTLVLTR